MNSSNLIGFSFYYSEYEVEVIRTAPSNAFTVDQLSDDQRNSVSRGHSLYNINPSVNTLTLFTHRITLTHAIECTTNFSTLNEKLWFMKIKLYTPLCKHSENS